MKDCERGVLILANIRLAELSTKLFVTTSSTIGSTIEVLFAGLFGSVLIRLGRIVNYVAISFSSLISFISMILASAISSSSDSFRTILGDGDDKSCCGSRPGRGIMDFPSLFSNSYFLYLLTYGVV